VCRPGNSTQLEQDVHCWHSDVITSLNNRVEVFQLLQSWLPVLLQREVCGLEKQFKEIQT